MTESGNDLAVELTPRGRKVARWTSAFFMGLLVTLALVAGSSSSKPPENPVKSATVFQKGRQLVFRITIRPEVVIKDMQRMPDVSKASTRYLCAEFSSSPAKATKRLCVGGKNRTYESIGLTLVGGDGGLFNDLMERLELVETDMALFFRRLAQLDVEALAQGRLDEVREAFAPALYQPLPEERVHEGALAHVRAADERHRPGASRGWLLAFRGRGAAFSGGRLGHGGRP
jgi:hypothetical protein